MKSIVILLFFFNSFLVAVFGFFEPLYPVTTKYQISYPSAFYEPYLAMIFIP